MSNFSHRFMHDISITPKYDYQQNVHHKLTTSTMKIYGALSGSKECRFSCGNRPGHGMYHIYLTLKWMKPQKACCIAWIEIDETTKKHHIYLALKWMKSQRNITHILH